MSRLVQVHMLRAYHANRVCLRQNERYIWKRSLKPSATIHTISIPRDMVKGIIVYSIGYHQLSFNLFRMESTQFSFCLLQRLSSVFPQVELNSKLMYFLIPKCRFNTASFKFIFYGKYWNITHYIDGNPRIKRSFWEYQSWIYYTTYSSLTAKTIHNALYVLGSSILKIHLPWLGIFWLSILKPKF